MDVDRKKSMRPIRALGIVALSALILSLAPPFAGVGWAAGSVASGKLAALDTTSPEIGISFFPDGDAGQCGNPGQQWAAAGGWTSPIRFNTDNRGGGCQLAFGVHDPTLSLAGLSVTYRWQVSPGGDARQCGNQGTFQAPITSFGVFGSSIRVDTDDKSGWCNLTFTVSGRSDVGLDIQFWPDGVAGQCVNYLPQGQYVTAWAGAAVTIGINTDSRGGGCQFSLRLRTG